MRGFLRAATEFKVDRTDRKRKSSLSPYLYLDTKTEFFGGAQFHFFRVHFGLASCVLPTVF